MPSCVPPLHHCCRRDTAQEAVEKLRGEVSVLRASVEMDEDLLAALQGEAGAGAGAGDYTGPGSSSAVDKRIAAAKAAWDKSHQAKLAELEASLRAKFDEESAELRGREKGARKELDRLRAQLADVRKELAAAQKASSDLMKVRDHAVAAPS